ncbi:FAD-binding oxidoreductase [Caballeronia sordidicola]|uniref:FAD-linked oxidoreductase family n=1 Tax=Caballeronia sordidicola TaxID=196367 RepID=A0A242MA55_CABSO|nr:FAD-binding oxidoreductase [Caballeronia sordidicola]OTP68070.1 FAD-linked oxidoreductase family [Caballeronia sordidicola]
MDNQDKRSRLTSLRAKLELARCEVDDAPSQSNAVRRRWNGALSPCPALIAGCDSTVQVVSALRAASEENMPISVYSGGRDWEGRSLRDGTVVLDISTMTSIDIDVEKREAVIGGGVTAGQLNEAAGAKKLVAVIGNDGSVGMAGLLLGGGYGPLMGRLGLACDNLLSAEVVLADGSVVTCDAKHEPDLFWALRGGGGNFGIVTSARVRLHKLDEIFAGNIVFAWTDARSALTQYANLMLHAPADLFGAAVMSVGPGGDPIVVISLVWTGESGKGETFVAQAVEAGNPILVKTGPMPTDELLFLTHGKLAQGRGYEVATRWFRDLVPRTLETLVEGFEQRSSPLSSIILHHCHGAATQVAPDETAFGSREPHFTAFIYSTWDLATVDASIHCEWAKHLGTALVPGALPGGYANLLSDTAANQISDAYGPNALRLAQIKTYYDPKRILNAIPLPIVPAGDTHTG